MKPPPFLILIESLFLCGPFAVLALLANLVAAEGHPPEVMAQSFSNQILSIMYILKNHKKIGNKIITVPEEIDKQVAVDALKAMDVKIDKLNSEQIKYANSW